MSSVRTHSLAHSLELQVSKAFPFCSWRTPSSAQSEERHQRSLRFGRLFGCDAVVFLQPASASHSSSSPPQSSSSSSRWKRHSLASTKKEKRRRNSAPSVQLPLPLPLPSPLPLRPAAAAARGMNPQRFINSNEPSSSTSLSRLQLFCLPSGSRKTGVSGRGRKGREGRANVSFRGGGFRIS